MHPPIQVPKSRKHAVTRVLATGIHESLFVLLFEPGSNMLIGGIIDCRVPSDQAGRGICSS